MTDDVIQLDFIDTFDDVIQLDFIDSYRNLSRKTIYSLRWVMTHCPSVKYILKQHDDTFVRLDKLVTALHDLELLGPTTFIAGHRVVNNIVVKDPKSMYYTPAEMYNATHYPHAANGPAYVITTSAVPALLQQVDSYTRPWLTWEDMFVTGVLRQSASTCIVLYDVKGMAHTPCGAAKRRPSDYNILSYHRVRANNHRDLFQDRPCVEQTNKQKN